jgi:N,N-dimethylformamidase
MLLGYVSDEMYVAIAGALVELRQGDVSIEAHSRASGGIHAEVGPGAWEVILSHPGHTRKTVQVEFTEKPHQFRLMSDRLLGYMWPKWIEAGGRGQIRLHATRPAELSLWRYGLSRTLAGRPLRYEPLAPWGGEQILPDGDFTISGARWNEHGYAFPPNWRQQLTAPEETGLYYVQVRDDAGRTTSFPWIVSPRQPSARIAVLASNITWNAYNDFGGRSNYVAADRLPDVPVINPHQHSQWFRDTGARWWIHDDYDPLSFDRPEPINAIQADEKVLDPLRRFGTEHVAPGEWRLLAWLEREGFGYDFYAETQLHAGALDLGAYDVLILSTHPEYWSRLMYERVKAWVHDAGGRLMYLGGNGINCAVELSGGPDVMRVHNTDVSEWLPTRSLAGAGIDMPDRFGRVVEPESRLLGVGSSLSGAMTSAPYRVLKSDHWVFEGTQLKDGDLFGVRNQLAYMPGGASGHETDKIDSSSPATVELLAKGTNPDEGGAEITHYETPTGGAVFSVGSISWGQSILIDDQVSRITANVIHRFSRAAGGATKRAANPTVEPAGER